jgi:hypothetical protein
VERFFLCRSAAECRDPTKLMTFKELRDALRLASRRRIQPAVDRRPFFELDGETIAEQSSKLPANRNDKRREFLRGV